MSKQYPDCDSQLLLRIIARKNYIFASLPYKVLVREEFVFYDPPDTFRWGLTQELKEWIGYRFEGRPFDYGRFEQAFSFKHAEDASLFRMMFGE